MPTARLSRRSPEPTLSRDDAWQAIVENTPTLVADCLARPIANDGLCITVFGVCNTPVLLLRATQGSSYSPTLSVAEVLDAPRGEEVFRDGLRIWCVRAGGGASCPEYVEAVAGASTNNFQNCCILFLLGVASRLRPFSISNFCGCRILVLLDFASRLLSSANTHSKPFHRLFRLMLES